MTQVVIDIPDDQAMKIAVIEAATGKSMVSLLRGEISYFLKTFTDAHGNVVLAPAVYNEPVGHDIVRRRCLIVDRKPICAYRNKYVRVYMDSEVWSVLSSDVQELKEIGNRSERSS